MKASSRSLLLPLLIWGPIATASQATAQVRHEFTEVHMGIPVRIALYAPDDTIARAAARAAFRRIASLEDVFSDYRTTSELRQLEQRAGEWVQVSEPLFDVLQRALDIARRTDGAFDPTVGPLSALWRTARRTGVLPERAAIDSARQLVGWQLVRLDTIIRSVRLQHSRMRLDLGGIAKGYILQHALRTLEQHGAAAALLDAGGDIVVGAAPPGRPGWTIELPRADSGLSARAAKLTHTAVATSGPTYQYVEVAGTRYSHLIDPRTGQAVEHTCSAHVVAADAVTADALATALAVLGPAAQLRLRHQFPGVDANVACTTPARTGNANY